jgi:hypothetical protein
MGPAESSDRAIALMTAFAKRTGLTDHHPGQRYLWTDAFAVCNFLGLSRVTGENSNTEFALRLIDQVHHVLGHHRVDDLSTGWLSGLGEREGEDHPTRGGLRIGKKHPERRPEEPFDERLEWDRDGQYFHYLTKWMHALDLASRSTGDPRLNLWARELAHVAHASFSFRDHRTGRRRMVWKMSTDLSRPLIPSMGQHDPLDGFVTCIQLEATAALLRNSDVGPSLKKAIVDFATMLGATDPSTTDPLGLGGLLSDAWRVAQLMAQGGFDGESLLGGLLSAAEEGLSFTSRVADWWQPASRRLAFRELGLAIGLSAVDRLRASAERDRHLFGSAELRAQIEALAQRAGLGAEIVSFWLRPEHQESHAWLDHRDINEVMLATSLLPEGYLVIPAQRPKGYVSGSSEVAPRST